MVGHLLKLKLALLRGGLRAQGAGGVIGLAIALLIAVGFGGVAAVGLATLRAVKPDTASTIAAGAFTVLLFGWVVGPVVTLASDNTLEPDRLALLPLTARQLMPGFLLASTVGVGGLFTVVVLTGGVIGMAPSTPAVVITILAAVTEVALCVTSSRLVGTLLSGAARNRRWRDVALTVGPLLLIATNFGIQVWNRQRFGPQGYRFGDGGAIGRTVRWLPSGWPAVAMGAARRGDLLAAVGLVVATAGLTVVLLWGWWRALGRLTTRSPTAGDRRTRRDATLIPRWTPFFPANRVGAVAAKDLKYVWRDPRQRASTIAALMSSIIPLISIITVRSSNPKLVLFAAAPALTLSLNQANQFGFDGPAYWMNVAAGSDVRSDLMGKALARLTLGVVTVVSIGAVLTAVAGDVTRLPSAIALAIAAWGIAGGLAIVASVTAPYPLPDRSTNPFTSGGAGTGVQALGSAFGTLFASLTLLAPFVIAMLVFPATGWAQVVIGLAAAGAGIGAWRAGFAVAVHRADSRQVEILAALSPRIAG